MGVQKIVDKCGIDVGDDDSTNDGVEGGDNLAIDETHDPKESDEDGASGGAPDDVAPNNVEFVAFPDPPLSPPRNPGADSVSHNLIFIINRQTTSVPPQINSPPIPTDVTLTPAAHSTTTSTTRTEDTMAARVARMSS